MQHMYIGEWYPVIGPRGRLLDSYELLEPVREAGPHYWLWRVKGCGLFAEERQALLPVRPRGDG